MSEKKVTFELTIAEINIILECLSKLPFVDVFALINNLQSQFKNMKINQVMGVREPKSMKSSQPYKRFCKQEKPQNN